MSIADDDISLDDIRATLVSAAALHDASRVQLAEALTRLDEVMMTHVLTRIVHVPPETQPLPPSTTVLTSGVVRAGTTRTLGLSHSIPAGQGLLIGDAELALLPTTGAAWDNLLATANGSFGTPNVSNQDNKHSVLMLSAALVGARTGNSFYLDKARDAIMAAIGTERVGAGNSILALGRILGAYIVAADLIDLDGADDVTFRAWIDTLRTRNLGGHGRWFILKNTAEDSSNNWGAFAAASLIAANLYLEDTVEVERSWQVFKGFMGDLGSYVFRTPTMPASLLSWRCTGAPWTPINVASNCSDKLGAPPEDAHRSGAYPTISHLYVQETMQGLAFQAELLERAGFPAWGKLKGISDFATRWSVWNASNVGKHLPWWFNRRLGAGAPTVQPVNVGRLMTYTDWLYG